jgi:CheY-like chemotaxis protein
VPECLVLVVDDDETIRAAVSETLDLEGYPVRQAADGEEALRLVTTLRPDAITLDLLLPVIGFGQEDAFGPRGWQQWLAAALVASGWILATTIAAGVSRVLSRH